MKLYKLIDKTKIRGIGQIAMFASILFFCTTIFRPRFKSYDDIKFIKGHFKEYSFTSYGRGGTSHLFWLKEYPNAFKISADFWSDKAFNKEEFSKFQSGDSITISIHKTEHNYFEKSGNYSLIYSIKTPSIDILKLDDAIKIYNRNFMLFAAIGFFLISIICLYFGYRKTKNVV